MLITSWTTDTLSQDGNDVRIEWEDGAKTMSVMVDDCEVETIGIGLFSLSASGAAVCARKYLEQVERLGTDMLIDRLNDAIERAQQLRLDSAYAEGGENP